MEKAYTNHGVKEIKKFVKQGWEISEHDKPILDVVGSKPLADLLRDEAGIKALQQMKNVICLTKMVQEGDAPKRKTKNVHLWENNEWMEVLKPAGPMIMVKKASDKKGKYIPIGDLTESDHKWVVKYPNGNPRQDEGFYLPTIGGMNFKTGDVVNKDSGKIVQRIELFHKWHDVSRVDRKVRTSAKATGKAVDNLAYCDTKIAACREAKDEAGVKDWTARRTYFEKF